MNIVLIFFKMFCGPAINALLNICLSIWAIMHVNELGWDQLQINQNTIGLAALKDVIYFIKLSKVEINFIKNYIEVFTLIVVTPGVFFNQSALILPVIFYQYMKIKYASNRFLRYIVDNIWDCVEIYCPLIIQILKMFGFQKIA